MTIKKLIFKSLLFIAVILPANALAAYNDVTLTTSAVIQVGSYSLDVTGSSATIQSITVNNSNFNVTLASGSSIQISSPALNVLSSDIQTDVVSNVCSNTQSFISLAYSGAGTVTNTIIPSATSCNTGVPGAPTGVTATAGDGQATVSFTAPSNGGSPITGYTVTSTPYNITGSGSSSPITVMGLSDGIQYTFNITATNTSGTGSSSSPSNAVTPTASYSGGGGGGGGSSGGTVSSALLSSLLAGASTTPNCPQGFTCTTVLGGASLTSSSTLISSPVVFTENLYPGAKGSAVIALQNFLIARSYLAPSYATGYYGNLTQMAVEAYQKAKGITPVNGYFGPLTRASANAALGVGVSASPTQTQTGTTATVYFRFNRNLTVGSTGSDVLALQKFLNSNNFVVASRGPGSPGNESDYFGSATRAALGRLQSHYAITPAAGYFGTVTRAKVETLEE